MRREDPRHGWAPSHPLPPLRRPHAPVSSSASPPPAPRGARASAAPVARPASPCVSRALRVLRALRDGESVSLSRRRSGRGGVGALDRSVRRRRRPSPPRLRVAFAPLRAPAGRGRAGPTMSRDAAAEPPAEGTWVSRINSKLTLGGAIAALQSERAPGAREKMGEEGGGRGSAERGAPRPRPGEEGGGGDGWRLSGPEEHEEHDV